jgi:hypothetical protein
MLKSFAFLALFSAILIGVQNSPRSIAITKESNVSSKDILQALQKECPNVSIADDESKSDFTLKARKRTNEKGVEEGGFDFTLFDHEGNISLRASSPFLDSVVKSVCRAVNSSPNKK